MIIEYERLNVLSPTAAKPSLSTKLIKTLMYRHILIIG